MNARDLLHQYEHEALTCAPTEEAIILTRALRLLAAAEGGEGTPETDAAWAPVVASDDLGAAIAQAGDQIRGWRETSSHLERERNALAARVRELEGDAERYRWLRSNTPDYRGLVAVIDLKRNVDAWLYGEYLDAAIDAAGSKP